MKTLVENCGKAAQDAGYQVFALGNMGSKYKTLVL